MSILSPLRCQASRLAGPASRRTFSTTRVAQTDYGFIGLGRMGSPMARNLRNALSSSDKLVVYDINKDLINSLTKEAEGIEAAQNVREVAEKSEIIITALPEPHHVSGVFQSMLQVENGAKQRLFIDCSTIDPKTSASIANATHSSGKGKFVDAPMSGGVVGAEKGNLTFMIGAPDDLVDRVSEVLNKMGKRVLHLGPQTSGLKGKLANNYLLALNNIATAEAMNMGVTWGLEPKALANMINTSTGKCWPSEVNNPVPGVSENAPASKEYADGFITGHANKDLKLAMQAARESGIEPRLGPLANSLYNMIEADEDLKGKDFSIVYKYIRRAQGQ